MIENQTTAPKIPIFSDFFESDHSRILGILRIGKEIPENPYRCGNTSNQFRFYLYSNLFVIQFAASGRGIL